MKLQHGVQPDPLEDPSPAIYYRKRMGFRGPFIPLVMSVVSHVAVVLAFALFADRQANRSLRSVHYAIRIEATGIGPPSTAERSTRTPSARTRKPASLPVPERRLAQTSPPAGAASEPDSASDLSENEGGASALGLFRDAYLQDLWATIASQKRYPTDAKSRGHTGRVTVSFKVKRDGSLEDIRILEPCAHPSLNDAAMETFARIGSLKPFPPELAVTHLRLQVSLKFGLGSR